MRGAGCVLFWGALAVAAAQAPSVFEVRAENLTFLGSTGPYSIPISLILDRGRAVGAYVPRTSQLQQMSPPQDMGEVTLFASTWETAPASFPALPRYGWAWLPGPRITTVPWTQGEVTAWGTVHNVSVTVVGNGSAVLVREWQSWTPSNGSSLEQEAWTEVLVRSVPQGDVFPGVSTPGAAQVYVAEVTCFLSSNDNSSVLDRAELLNFLTPKMANPLGSVGQRTVWTNATSAKANAFADNLVAGNILGAYGEAVPGLVTILGSSSSSSAPAPSPPPMLAWTPGLQTVAVRYPDAPSVPGAIVQQTCSTWMDQHHEFLVPRVAANATRRSVLAELRLGFLDADAAAALWDAAQLVVSTNSNRRQGAVMLRLGTLEGFEQQPLSLAQPVRGLVRNWWLPDFPISSGVVRSGAQSLALPAANASAAQADDFAVPQPLVPIEPHSLLDIQVFVAVNVTATPGCDATAWATLRVDSFEADDFYGSPRLIARNVSTPPIPCSAPSAVPAAFLPLSIRTDGPAYASYADLRLESWTTDASCCNATAFFDDLLFLAVPASESSGAGRS